jgi:hypothetical protein
VIDVVPLPSCAGRGHHCCRDADYGDGSVDMRSVSVGSVVATVCGKRFAGIKNSGAVWKRTPDAVSFALAVIGFHVNGYAFQARAEGTRVAEGSAVEMDGILNEI